MQQKVGFILIWLKRIAPFVIMVLIYFGYTFYIEKQVKKKITDEKRYAHITAQAWIGSMKYRDNPDLYIAFRDSLLEANNLSNDSLKIFIESYRSKAEYLVLMSSYIKNDVDSILHLDDSLKSIADSIALVDSLALIDSLAVTNSLKSSK